ncbi:hypothetical protein EVAR_85355_1 [Eumeta japonica]|uniref:Uncharacterized protein n=1 Tax=Eumeta variegata TaxID=151549 RepID=A0A4C1WTW6_EUMVA|nr:hypothetical protein EVAR_85355_1 [Eumeta japonica]
MRGTTSMRQVRVRVTSLALARADDARGGHLSELARLNHRKTLPERLRVVINQMFATSPPADAAGTSLICTNFARLNLSTSPREAVRRPPPELCDGSGGRYRSSRKKEGWNGRWPQYYSDDVVCKMPRMRNFR